MITSKTKNDNYFGYLIFEILMVSVTTFLGIVCIVFYAVGKSDNRQESRNLEYLFDNIYIFGLIGFLPALLAVLALLYFRNRNYIVGFDFDDDNQKLHLVYRRLKNKTLFFIEFNYPNIELKNFKERKILFNQVYNGLSLKMNETNKTLDFVLNNYIWEKHPRERISFVQKLNDITEKINRKVP